MRICFELFEPFEVGRVVLPVSIMLIISLPLTFDEMLHSARSLSSRVQNFLFFFHGERNPG